MSKEKSMETEFLEEAIGALERWFCPPDEQKKLNNPPIVGYLVFNAAGVKFVKKTPKRIKRKERKA